jgi:hypothetical protein
MNFVFVVIQLGNWKAAALVMRRLPSSLLRLSVGKLNSDQSDKRETSFHSPLPPTHFLCKPFLEQIFRIRIHFTGIINEDRPDKLEPDCISDWKSSCYIHNALSASLLVSVNGRHGSGGGGGWV